MTEKQIEHEEAVLRIRLAPAVKSLKLLSDKFFHIADGAKFELAVPAEAADVSKKIVSDNAQMFWSINAKVSIFKDTDIVFPENVEGYSIKVMSSKTVITASSVAGVRYATYTLRQLAESDHVGQKTTEFLLPCVAIVDEPAMAFRGMHFCWFPAPETTYNEMERQIRLAAYYKMNYAVIESWGIIRYQSHPEFCWSEHSIAPGEIRRLVDLAKQLGLTLIPQLNIFGHAAQARCYNAKHVLLDVHPEFSALFEPNGWCWCLSNKATRAFLDDIVNELMDIFDNPPFFHIGCDEAEGAATCVHCRRADYNALLIDHLDHFRKLIKERGARPLIWHDMFLNRADKRWNGYIVNGTEAFAQVCKKMSRDYVMCDWQYGFPTENGKLKEPTWATTKEFIDQGFDTLVSPWLDASGIKSLGKFIADNHGFGMLETTWHMNRNLNSYTEFFIASLAAWNPHYEIPSTAPDTTHMVFNLHVRTVTHDMGVTKYEEFGTSPYQIHGPFCES